jgi:uroporphyrinogen decarboxylase
MRQAGRYMPEYRAIRSKYSFLEMCHTPDLAAEITQLPLCRFGFDAAILFSDILMVPEALDVGLRFEESVGPIIERPLRTVQDVESLPHPAIAEKLNFVAEAIRHLKAHIKVPLIGFCGAPFTVASYMIEGGTSKTFKLTKQWMLREPVVFHKLLEKITRSTVDYLTLQMDAGVDAIQIFDSWAWVLDEPHFREFALAYMDKLVKAIGGKVPSILFCRGSSAFAKAMATAQPSALSIDWNGSLADLRKTLPPNLALQGNLDPDILYAPPATVKAKVTALLHTMRGDPGYIFNLGHGISPDVPVESVQALVDAVHSFNPA